MDLEDTQQLAVDLDVRLRKAEVAARLFGEPLEPVKIGRFTIVRKLGAGGVGVVYVAYDERLDRRVAVKLLHGVAPSPEARARFEREAQAMARLSHPNVITVHEVGTHESQVYVAMEFVEGQDLRGWMRAEPRSWRAVIEMFRQAGEGLAAAHDAGIVHRDFKPDNVLLGDDGRVRVADFGHAHGFGAALELPTSTPAPAPADSQGGVLESPLTRTGTIMGTPAYMAPEQYAGLRSDARGDQFSFCVALWEALYGQRPFAGDALGELSKAVTRGEITAPTDERGVPPWLRAIVIRGLAREPDERWPSMRALLDAVGDDPGLRRRRVLFGLGLSLGAVGLVGTAWLAVSELRHNARQRYYAMLTEQVLEIERDRGLRQAQDDAARASNSTRMTAARRFGPKLGVVEREDPAVAAALLREIEGDARRSSEWLSAANQLLGRPMSWAVLTGHQSALGPLVFSGDGAWLYSGADDGQVRRWNMSTTRGEVLIEHEKLVTALALSPDGELLVSASEDGTVRGWSRRTGAGEVLVRHDRPVTTVAFDPAGRRLASGSQDGTVRLLSLASGTSEILEQSAEVLALSFGPDGERLLVVSKDGKARLWRRGASVPERVLEGHEAAIYFVHMLADGLALTAGDDGTARLWDLDAERPEGIVIARHEQPISAFAVHGDRLATAATDGSMRVTSVEPPYPSIVLPSHADQVWALRFGPNGETIVSASFDKTARVTRTDGRGVPQELVGHRLELFSAAIDGSGRWLATGGYDAEIRLWDLSRPRLVTPLRGHGNTIFSVELDAAGTRAVTASHDGTVRIWDIRDGTAIEVLDTRGDLNPAAFTLNHALFSPDGTRVATARTNGEVELWTLDDGGRRVLTGHNGAVWRLAFDPAGRRLASASYDGTARLWSVETGEQLQVLHGHENRVVDVAFDRTAERVITASWDGTARIWDVTTGTSLAVLRGHTGKLLTLEPSPDGRLWATGANDGTVRLWPADLSDAPLVLAGHEKDVWSVSFSADGRRVLTASHDGRARLWDSDDGRLLATIGDNTQIVWDAEFIAGDRVVTGSDDGVLRIWSLDPSAPVLMLQAHAAAISSLAVTAEGYGLLSVADDGTAALWDLDGLSTDSEIVLGRVSVATRYCLPPDLRMLELGEDRERAEHNADACGEQIAVRE